MMAMDHTERRRKKKARQIQTGDDGDFNINHTELLRQHLQKYRDGDRHCKEKAQRNDALHMLQQRSKEKEMDMDPHTITSNHVQENRTEMKTCIRQ